MSRFTVLDNVWIEINLGIHGKQQSVNVEDVCHAAVITACSWTCGGNILTPSVTA